MKENTNQSADPSTVKSGLSVLERAWDAQWALQLICIVLFFDMAMMLHARRGLWQWTDADQELLSNLGWIALVLAAFSFTVAIVMPMFLLALRNVSGELRSLLPTFSATHDDRPYQRPLGHVPARALHDLALQEKDAFLLRLYDAHREKNEAAERSRERAGDLMAIVLLAALADWLLSSWIQGSVGLIEAIAALASDWAPVAVMVILLYATSVVRGAWFRPYKPDLIYYPPLDRTLREQERRARELL